MAKDCLYIGSVFHKRFAPKAHTLRYRVFTLFADLDHLENIAQNCRFFSLNRNNLVSFHEADYGDPNVSKSDGLKNRLLDLLAERQIDKDKVKSIKVLAYPRILGFAFNPLTVFYCYGKKDEHIAIIYEVRNTFSERHNYIYEVPKNGTFNDQHSAEKCFHVSPFFDRNGTYSFSHTLPDEKVAVTINYDHSEGRRLTASFAGNSKEIKDLTLLKLSLKMPFMTLKVMGGILFEAIKLKLKGLKIYPHPEHHHYQSSAAIPHSKNKSTILKRDVK